jgi:hypothetical protein
MKVSLLRRLALLCALLVPAGVVRAGPVEKFAQLALHPTDPNQLVLRYENAGDGLFYSHDRGKTFELVCGSMIDAHVTRFGELALTTDGTALIGAFQGLWRGDAHGCSWQKETPFDGQWVADLTRDPQDAAVMYALTSTGSPALNGVYRRDALGNWSALGEQAPLFLDRLRVASLDAGHVRFYESAVVGAYNAMPGDVSRYVVRVSDDLAATWTEHAVDPEYASVEGQALRLEAVDPTNPDHLLFSVMRDAAPDDVLVSFDQGKHLARLAQVSSFGGATFAPDGRLWFGDAGEATDAGQLSGLWFARNLESEPRPLTRDYAVRCVNYQPATNTLFVCQPYAFGPVDPENGSAGPRFELANAPSFASCGTASPVDRCKAQLVNGYCGVTHFPEAPLCQPYGLLDALGGCAGAGCSTPAAGAAGLPPSAADAGRAASAGTAAVAGSPAAAGGEPSTCSVSAPGRARSHAAAGHWLLGLLISAFLVRCRRRAAA